MTVKELKELLDKEDDDRIVVVYDQSFENDYGSIEHVDRIDDRYYTNEEGDEVRDDLLVLIV